jgi:hypothetical protein
MGSLYQPIADRAAAAAGFQQLAAARQIASAPRNTVTFASGFQL